MEIIQKELVFKNIVAKDMAFENVYDHILNFMKNEPKAKYTLMIGTDSQAYSKYTKFITGIIIQREGNGAWACLRRMDYPKKISNLHEKVSIETALTEEIAVLFTDEKRKKLHSVIKPYNPCGSTFTMEGHLDMGVGENNKTKVYVSEMVKRIKSVGLEAKIKPYSMAATCYANKYTK